MSTSPRFTIISVQSRKGGVGKTTACLNIARNLVQKGCIVVVFDLDIAGTNISHVSKAKWWSDLVNVAIHPNSNSPINIVDVFENYMNNNEVLDFCFSASNASAIRLSHNKINVIPSFLNNDYDANRFTPSVLFDEIHSQWLLDYLKAIIKRCILATARHDANKHLCIILDNAPGYTGLEQLLEQWLTTIGPEIGKFLYVSSLDPQDLEACFKSAQNIFDLYKRTVAAAKLYNDDQPPDNSIFSLNDSVVSRLFSRLAEVETRHKSMEMYRNFITRDPSSIIDGLFFYSQCQKQFDEYLTSPNMFIGILINKVPDILRGLVNYNYTAGSILNDYNDTDESNVLIADLCINSNIIDRYPALKSISMNIVNYFVYYDASYSLQFYLHLLKKYSTKRTIRIASSPKSVSDARIAELHNSVSTVVFQLRDKQHFTDPIRIAIRETERLIKYDDCVKRLFHENQELKILSNINRMIQWIYKSYSYNNLVVYFIMHIMPDQNIVHLNKSVSNMNVDIYSERIRSHYINNIEAIMNAANRRFDNSKTNKKHNRSLQAILIRQFALSMSIAKDSTANVDQAVNALEVFLTIHERLRSDIAPFNVDHFNDLKRSLVRNNVMRLVNEFDDIIQLMQQNNVKLEYICDWFLESLLNQAKHYTLLKDLQMLTNVFSAIVQNKSSEKLFAAFEEYYSNRKIPFYQGTKLMVKHGYVSYQIGNLQQDKTIDIYESALSIGEMEDFDSAIDYIIAKNWNI